jgi:AcrR family transcriptional regulator
VSASAPSAARRRILDTAFDLFYREGVRAVGVDRIVAESGVAKMTLYKHFPSKDELILAVIQEQDERAQAKLQRDLDARATEPRARLLALFDVLDAWLHAPGYCGCIFQNTSIALADRDHAAQAAVEHYKRGFRSTVSELVEAARLPERLSDELVLLFEGAYVVSHVEGNRDAAQTARRVAEQLIAQAEM